MSGCTNCRHGRKLTSATPCCYCFGFSMWEPPVMTDLPSYNCKDCVFFKPVENKYEGTCHGGTFDPSHLMKEDETKGGYCDNFKPKWESKPDTAIRPSHYQRNGMEAFDVIEAFELDFNLGNVFKYVARAGYKGDKLEDLKKARCYLDRAISKLE